MTEKPPAASNQSRRRYYRPPHRMRNHDEAHRDAAGVGVPPVLEHESVPGNEPQVVTDQPALDALVEELRSAGSFGYDTEFIGEQTFYPRLCVLQVATTRRVSLIDALAGLDLSAFWALLADDAVEKIVHAGRQDLEPVMRFLGKTPRRIFDVQVAAGFAGSAYPASLERLVEDFTGADTGHGLKFSQWDHRPLSDVQKQYAANDVRYLPLLREVLWKKISAMGNVAALETEQVAQERPELYRFDPLGQRVRAKGVGALGRRKQGVLRSLLAWRGELARAEDVPPRMLVKDDVLMALVLAEVTSVGDLDGVKGLPRPVREEFSDQIVAAVEAGRAGPLPEKKPKLSRLTDAQKARIDAIWHAAQAACEQRGIAPGLALAKRDVTHFVRVTTDTEPDTPLPDSPMLQGWREGVLGDVLRSA